MSYWKTRVTDSDARHERECTQRVRGVLAIISFGAPAERRTTTETLCITASNACRLQQGYTHNNEYLRDVQRRLLVFRSMLYLGETTGSEIQTISHAPLRKNTSSNLPTPPPKLRMWCTQQVTPCTSLKPGTHAGVRWLVLL